MASPIAWEHHYGILLPIFSLIAPLVLAGNRMRPWLLTGSFLLTANYVIPTRAIGWSWIAALYHSLVLVGALLALLLLYKLAQSWSKTDPKPVLT
jgi:hypothetical protein